MNLREFNDGTYQDYEEAFNRNIDIYDYDVVVDAPDEELYLDVTGYKIDHSMRRIIIHAETK